jgi:tRNA pseudouridine55 synthase
VEPKACTVTVHEISSIGQDGDRLRLRIACSAGFYVRSFANELGLIAGAGAHLSALRRTRSGDFDIASAVPLEAIEREGPSAAALLTPIDALLPSLPAVAVNERGATRTRHGNDLRTEDLVSPFAVPHGDSVRLIDERGVLLAIAEPCERPGVLHPAVVVV